MKKMFEVRLSKKNVYSRRHKRRNNPITILPPVGGVDDKTTCSLEIPIDTFRLQSQQYEMPIALPLPQASTLVASQEPTLSTIDFIRPYAPMLAKVPTAFDKLPYDELLLEEKFDGERMLAFVCAEDGRHRCYTRNLKVCNIFPHIIQIKGIENCIVDGEVVYTDHVTGAIIPICDVKSRNAMHIQYRIFDIQSLNGENIMHKSLLERKDLLTKHVMVDKHVRLSKWELCRTHENVLKIFASVTSDINAEGLMLKHIHGTYKPNVREWLKMKALNILANKHDYDLYIHRFLPDKNGILSILDCGYYNGPSNNDYVHVVYVSGGINNDIRTKLTLMCDEKTHYMLHRQIVTLHADRRVTSNKSLRHPTVHRLRNDLDTIDISCFI